MSSSYFSEPDYDNLAAYPPPAPTHSFDHHGYFVPDSLPAVDSTAANPPPPIYASAGGEIPLGSAYFSSETPILPPPAEMGRDGGYALREWRRQNAIRLEEKEKREKEVLNQIIREADAYKVQFQKKWELNCESNRVANREKEKVFIASLQKFHTEAGKDYWKSIAEVIPKEEGVVKGKLKKDEDKGKEKEKMKKPSVCIIQGPKPGKPTNLTMMRQLLLKMKHSSPPHLKLSSLPPEMEVPAPSANR